MERIQQIVKDTTQRVAQDLSQTLAHHLQSLHRQPSTDQNPRDATRSIITMPRFVAHVPFTWSVAHASHLHMPSKPHTTILKTAWQRCVAQQHTTHNTPCGTTSSTRYHHYTAVSRQTIHATTTPTCLDALLAMQARRGAPGASKAAWSKKRGRRSARRRRVREQERSRAAADRLRRSNHHHRRRRRRQRSHDVPSSP